MPARDKYHNAVRQALVRDGWTITHDPYPLPVLDRTAFVDLGAERPIAAEKSGRKIAVEIKTFLGASELKDLEQAVGQYVFYRSLLERGESDRELYLAVPDAAFVGILSEQIAQPVIQDMRVAFLVFDPQSETIKQWIP